MSYTSKQTHIYVQFERGSGGGSSLEIGDEAEPDLDVDPTYYTATDEMSNLTVLRSYAQKSNPASLPSSVLLSYTPKSLTIFDVYPKSIFHFLVLPRVTPQLAVFDLASLRTLFKADKIKAKEVLTGLSEDAQTVKVTIQDEMMRRYGFKWSVWMGFHAVPSMESVLKHRSWLFNLTSNMLAHIGMSMYTFCRPISALLQ
jgi:hypothetical protein